MLNDYPGKPQTHGRLSSDALLTCFLIHISFFDTMATMEHLFKGLTDSEETFDGSDLRIAIVHGR